MNLHNEFEVAVPVEEVWPALLDIERVARFLPGAEIEPSDEPGVFNGSMRVKLGPMVVNYKGTARLGEVDEAARSAAIEVEAREARGQGRAAATITNRLVEESGGTRVIADTDLRITGRQAQFGRGIMQDVAGSMLDDFARRFEASLRGEGVEAVDGGTEGVGSGGAGDSSVGASSVAPAPAQEPLPPHEDALDMGAIVGRTQSARYAGIGAAALAFLLLLLLLRRR
jgi:carbon monoxide dehydrogenase subunit G